MAKSYRWLLIALSLSLGVSAAEAQGKRGKKGAKAGVTEPAKSGKRTIDLDADGDDGKSRGDDEGPVTAGEMTEAAAQAKRLFDQERWGEAAMMLKQVVDGESNDDAGNRQIAHYHLAIALYRLKFFQASYDIFRRVADNPNHLKFKETLLWLAKLATQLPEPADIIGAVGKYSKDQVARFNNDQQRDLFFQLNYLLGRSMYRQREFQQAIDLFSSVKKGSPYFVKSQFFMGISYVQLTKSAPAVRAFQRIIEALDEGVEGVEDEARMRDLANLSIARTLYSASTRLDQNNVPKIDGKKIGYAVQYWNQVDVGSEYWLDALFEQSWAYFMASDFPRALGNIHTIQSPYFPNSFFPEAEILRAVIYFMTCQYDDATSIVARFDARFVPIQKELSAILKRFEGEGSEQKFFDFLIAVRDGKANLSPAVEPIVKNALSDRELLRNIEYVSVLDQELERFASANKGFQNSPVGADVEDNVKIAKTDAMRKAGELARRRYRRNLTELEEHLRSAQKIIVDITNAQRKKLDEQIEAGKWSQEDAYEFGRVSPDEEHVIWPYRDEYWRDELGFYRQVVQSQCGSGK
ncbi:MAG: hypothetical protein EXR75_08325 [Myxococcales bacterium]|nr:hypothetical protein [Myxococcales bacterium]